MNTHFTLPLACLLAIPAVAIAADGPLWSIGVEAGPVWQSKNDVQIPGDTGTRFALDVITGTPALPPVSFGTAELNHFRSWRDGECPNERDPHPWCVAAGGNGVESRLRHAALDAHTPVM